ncbi:RND family transporter [Acidocella sp. KAb 2-4]|uniref:efflux RND transporter permease subunit n=1 Tax=Acidocella sp. KAb 2-4 TaxID=2885158 RepID=UPI001D063F1B|nr:MMPL family transporter [Acidocella sp. KAb 2-4]MCB5945500.1 MMPL family transporter [Acidocella sp. KAb 2-4]
MNIDDQAPVIADLADFDRQSGTVVERLLFNNRLVVLTLCLIATIFFSWQATHTRLNASFEKMIPTHQPFIVNFLNHYEDLQSQGNAIRIVVEANQGSIINAHYLAVLQKLNDEIFLLPGVDRSYMTSLWTPSTRWLAVTPDGLEGGPVIDSTYDGSPAQLDIVRQNIAKTGKVGELVGSDYKSSMIYVPLMSTQDAAGTPLDYGALARRLNDIRARYAQQGVTLHIVGFAMVVGDMINAIGDVLIFFGAAVLIATGILFWYTRCVRSTALVVIASIVAVTWQMGMLPLLGFDLNPYSVLVPFLIFAIGMSHGAQKMNGVMQDIGRGMHPLVAARYTFRRLFLAGLAALTCDAASFAVLMTIRIDAIRELALIASIGVAILIFTNLIMLPMLLSYTGVSRKAALRSLRYEVDEAGGRVPHPLWDFLDLFTQRRYAALAIMVAVGLGGAGWVVGSRVQVGDLTQGAPELRQSSQYNQDNAYIVHHYTNGSDTMVVLVDTQPYQCNTFKTISVLDDLEWRLNQMPQVQSTSSIASFSQMATMLMTENAPKWYAIIRNQQAIDDLAPYVPTSLENFSCTFDPVYVSLTDHKAATLKAVVNAVQNFAADPRNQAPTFKISLAGGNAGIEAATNIVIEQANNQMLYLVYATVIIFCYIAFRSWRAVLCAVLPLVLTSILAQALMVMLGIGIKVATLPVIALGVGIGVDYALYVLSITLKQLRAGASLSDAYHRTLLFTGKVVLLTGFTLAVGVVTWVLAPIKFQADMGLLLAFMFVLNMLGALILLPSLAYFLLPRGSFQPAAAVAARPSATAPAAQTDPAAQRREELA